MAKFAFLTIALLSAPASSQGIDKANAGVVTGGQSATWSSLDMGHGPGASEELPTPEAVASHLTESRITTGVRDYAGVSIPNGAETDTQPAEKGRQWRFEVTPYFWAISTKADVSVNTLTAEVKESFLDVADYIDGGFALHAEAWYGDLGLILDGLYTDLSYTETYSVGPVSAETSTKIRFSQYEITPAWRVSEIANGEHVNPAFFDLFAGTRHSKFSLEASATGLGPLGLTSEVDSDQSWFDLIVGTRFGTGISNWLSFGVRGDIGGFGIGESSKFTYKTSAELDFHFTSWIAAQVGYQVLGIDRTHKVNGNNVGFDGILYGPFIGISFTF